MATINIDSTDNLLVSDSNEKVNLYDSKKLSCETLAELAQTNLFRRHLGIMDRYLTNNQFATYKKILTLQKGKLKEMWNTLKDQSWSGTFRSVPGQVILVEKESFDAQYSDENKTPEEYVREKWDIPSDCYLKQLHNCMLRGMTGDVQDTI